MPLRLAAFIFLCLSSISFSAEWEETYAQLLKKYATPDGVRYAAWKGSAGDLAALRSVVEEIAAAKKPGGSGPDTLAFYLNAYNAWILHEALEKYPTRSVLTAPFTFFITKRIRVAGEKMSFDRLEKKIIIPQFREPRIHAALNCASRGCPPLRAEPFTARKLDAQLDAQSRLFVNSDNGVRLTRSGAELSAIFDWYKEDFGGMPGVIAFINKHRATPLPVGVKVGFQKYDWRLNEAR